MHFLPICVSFSVNCQMIAVSGVSELCKRRELAHCCHTYGCKCFLLNLLLVFLTFFLVTQFYFYGVKFIRLFLCDFWRSPVSWPHSTC